MSRRPTPITIDGVEYPSLKAAAAARGVTIQAIWHRAHPEWRRAQWKKEDHRRRTDRRPERQRWTRLSDDDAALANRLLPMFPKCTTIDELVSCALRRLAETTDD